MSILDFISILKTGSDFSFDVFQLCFSVFGFDIVLFIVTSFGVIFAAKCISNSHSADVMSTLKTYHEETQRRVESQKRSDERKALAEKKYQAAVEKRKAAYEKGRQSASNKKSGD